MKTRTFWAVGASHAGVDVSAQFLAEGIWYDGYAESGDDQNASSLADLHPGDVLVMKSSATKGKNHQVTFTRVKGIGLIRERLAPHRFRVGWLSLPDLPRDIEGVSYRRTLEPLRDDALLLFAKAFLIQETQSNLLDLLKTRHQIILQGPPGTGKTYMAKKLAAALTEPKRLGQSSSVFDNFEAFWQDRLDDLEEQQKKNQTLLREFQKKFPVDNLKSLSLEEYAVGTGTNDSFCWWIERGLKPLGYYSPGSARSYLIYWSEKKEEYSLHGLIMKGVDSPEVGMEKLGGLLHQLLVANEPYEVQRYMGKSLILKILHSYHPDKYFPINGQKHLDGALALLGMDPKAYKSMLDKNQALQKRFEAEKAQRGFSMGNVDFMGYLSATYDLKGDLEISQEGEVLAKGAFKLVQFHPAYSYEDFVRGITAEVEEGGQVDYQVQNRVLVEMAMQAADSPNAKHVLLIDEINRANLPAVLGELIYALEYRGEPVESLYEHPEDGRSITLPDNLYLIGTMNTADRSVGHIDYAIRRRFAFVDMLPDPDVIQEPHGKQLFETVAKIFQNHLASDFGIGDVQLGHSYFMAESPKELQSRLEYEIKPILKEYLKDGVLTAAAKPAIDNLRVDG